MLKIGIQGNKVFIFAWNLDVKFLGVEENCPKTQQNTLLSSLHGLLLIISSSYIFWGNVFFCFFTLIELDISELDEPWSYLWLMLMLILFWLAHTFSVILRIKEYVFSVNDMSHNSKETESGRCFSISHYKYRGNFSVMFCMEMCRDRHDQERKNFFWFSHYVHYAMIKRKKIFFISHYVYYAIIKRENRFFSFTHYVHYIIIKREKRFFFI